MPQSTQPHHFKLEQLIPWSQSELIRDNITPEEVEDIAAIYGFTRARVNALQAAGKYNKQYNPSIDKDWVRLTKVFH